jgi:signal transduction histidine kinase
MIDELRRDNLSLRSELNTLRASFNELKDNAVETLLLLDELPLGEIILDKNARFIACNKQFASSLDYTQDDLYGTDFENLLAEGHEIHAKTFPAFLTGKGESRLIWKMKKKTGGVVTNILYPIAKFDDNGDFVYGRGYFFDITDKMELLEAFKKSENEKVLILQAMTESIAYYGKDLRLTWANDNAAKILRKEMSEIIGQHCITFCGKEEKYCSECPFNKTAVQQKPFSDEIFINDKLQISMVTHPVKDKNGEMIGIVQTVSDITEKKNLEKRLSELTTFERRKIGQDIHDGLSQLLTGTSFMASALQSDLENADSPYAKDAEEIVSHIKNAVTMMRGIVQGLCPLSIDPEGLITAFGNLATSITNFYKIKVTPNLDDSIEINNYDTANHIFLIAQEAICNAAKHSGCTDITIDLSRTKNFVKLMIKDNGHGIETDPSQSCGMGMKIMKIRSMAIKAQLTTKTKLNEGTTVSLNIPIINLEKSEEL